VEDMIPLDIQMIAGTIFGIIASILLRKVKLE
jgi:hypothetical protein